jgi:hypothetical protein
VSAGGYRIVKAVDLAIQKTAGAPVFAQGSVVTWTLNYQTSEYRYATGTVITDTLPSGLCPIGTVNYDSHSDPQCDPQGTVGPSVPYTTVTENADGTFTIVWDLPTLSPDTQATITFPSADRSAYQDSGVDTTPTLGGDSVTNSVVIDGQSITTCGPPIRPARSGEPQSTPGSPAPRRIPIRRRPPRPPPSPLSPS